MDIGKYNELTVARLVDFGVYLADDEENEVLLPAKYISELPEIGDKINVFVYTDSEDRPVAVTEHPFAQVGEFAFLDVVSVSRVGAFLDWGLPKDIFCPFREQKVRMRPGMRCLVYIYLDDVSKRAACSAKIEKFLGNVYPQYSVGDNVKALVYKHTEQGYLCVVDNLHQGIVYESNVYEPLEIGRTVDARVLKVRGDGKIDLVNGVNALQRTNTLSDRLLCFIEHNGGFTTLCDKSSPEEIKNYLQCSKKDFKKAVGHLLKEGKIKLVPDGIALFGRK